LGGVKLAWNIVCLVAELIGVNSTFVQLKPKINILKHLVMPHHKNQQKDGREGRFCD
jgi:hypothetical protein